MKIAVIGSGIAGLGSAWLLTRAGHEVHVFEKETRIGGHTHTVNVETSEGSVPVDTGFIVHNRPNYPNLIRLLEELGIETGPSDMSFAFQGPDQLWCSRGLNGVLADRMNLFRPRTWAFWREVFRFNRLGFSWLERGDDRTPLGVFLDAHAFSGDFRNHYIIPMAGAVWSTGPQEMLDFPALTLLRFFHNHGMLGATTQHAWRTIPGGTSRYLEPLSRPFQSRIRTGVADLRVRRVDGGVELRIPGEEPLHFDQLVFACHGDQVLPLLESPSPEEREVLSAFRGNVNPTWLHRDASLLPHHRRAWASWNVRREPRTDDRLLVTYHMNRLQPLATKQDLFLSLNPEGQVDEALVDRKLLYEHPRYDAEAIQAQKRWTQISGIDRLHFCGAYWRYGFHEDGLWSAIRVARSLGVEW